MQVRARFEVEGMRVWGRGVQEDWRKEKYILCVRILKKKKKTVTVAMVTRSLFSRVLKVTFGKIMRRNFADSYFPFPLLP